MGLFPNLRIEHTGQDLSTLLRVLNERLKAIELNGNENFHYAMPQVSHVIESDGTWTVLVPASDFEIEAWVLRVSGTTTNPVCDLMVDGVIVDSQTLTDTNVHEYRLSAPEPVARLQQIQVRTASMTAGEVVTASALLRRTAAVV